MELGLEAPGMVIRQWLNPGRLMYCPRIPVFLVANTMCLDSAGPAHPAFPFFYFLFSLLLIRSQEGKKTFWLGDMKQTRNEDPSPDPSLVVQRSCGLCMYLYSTQWQGVFDCWCLPSDFEQRKNNINKLIIMFRRYAWPRQSFSVLPAVFSNKAWKVCQRLVPPQK
jgi:hypothetical protein